MGKLGIKPLIIGEYLGDAVFGALDGTVTTFSVMAGAVGANLGHSAIIILGLANLLADGFSMAMSSYLSQKSHNQFVQKELVETLSGLNHKDPKQLDKIKKLYRHKGFRGHDFIHIYNSLRHDPKSFAEEILQSEGVDTTFSNPVISGFVSFFSFVLIGIIPVLAFLLYPSLQLSLLFCVVALILFTVGSLRSLLTSVSWFRGGLEVMLAGLTASGIAYLVGSFLESLLS